MIFGTLKDVVLKPGICFAAPSLSQPQIGPCWELFADTCRPLGCRYCDGTHFPLSLMSGWASSIAWKTLFPSSFAKQPLNSSPSPTVVQGSSTSLRLSQALLSAHSRGTSFGYTAGPSSSARKFCRLHSTHSRRHPPLRRGQESDSSLCGLDGPARIRSKSLALTGWIRIAHLLRQEGATLLQPAHHLHPHHRREVGTSFSSGSVSSRLDINLDQHPPP